MKPDLFIPHTTPVLLVSSNGRVSVGRKDWPIRRGKQLPWVLALSYHLLALDNSFWFFIVRRRCSIHVGEVLIIILFEKNPFKNLKQIYIHPPSCSVK